MGQNNSFTIVTKTIKYQGINLTKKFKIYVKNTIQSLLIKRDKTKYLYKK